MTWSENTTVILMMIAASVLALLFITVRVSFGAKSVRGGVMAMFAKTLASIGFVMVGIMGISEGVHNVQAAIYVLFGLVMGLIGDIVLDLKVIYDGSDEEGLYLTGGMVSFGIGHIFYFLSILMFLSVSPVITGGFIGICIAIAVGLTAAIMLVGKFVMKFDFGKFLIHSIIYAFILTFMSVFTVGLCIALKNTVMLQFAIGMVLFLLSDVVLTQMYFGGKKKDNVLCIINHVFYYAAQICIASFICLM